MAIREHLKRLRIALRGSGSSPDAVESWSIDEELAPFVRVTLVDEGRFFAGSLFERKFGDSPPDMGHHMVAFYRKDERTFLTASYLHLWTQDTIGLIGGGCTDGNVLRAMAPHELRAVNRAGGLLRQTLGYCFARFEANLDAFFGHCGDPRAKEVDLAAGFTETEVPNLLVRYNRELAADRRQELLSQADAIGPF